MEFCSVGCSRVAIDSESVLIDFLHIIRGHFPLGILFVLLAVCFSWNFWKEFACDLSMVHAKKF